MRHLPFRATAALAAALLLATPATALASDSLLVPESAPTGVSVTEADAAAIQRAELFALAETQTQEEAQAIADAGHAEVLVDVDTWEVIAARRVSPLVQMRISHLLPGCSTTSACVHASNGTKKLGYTGTGVLKASLPSVTRFSAGNATTTLWSGVNYVATAPYTTKVMSKPITFDSIVRS